MHIPKTIARAWSALTLLLLIGGSAYHAVGQTNTFPSTGNAGVGTTSPSNPLVVVGGANSYSSVVQNPAAAGSSFGLLVDAGGNSSDFSVRIRQRTGGAELFAIRGDGNVGIGTTSPDSPLHVLNGPAMSAGWNRSMNLHATYPVAVFNSAASRWAGIGYDYSTAMRFWVNATSNDVPGTGLNAMTILNGGNVGIGTGNPYTRLHVSGGDISVDANQGIRKAGDNWIIGYSSSLPGIAIGSGTTSDQVAITSGGYERFRILTNGNVGIGTTSPQRTLDLGTSGQLTFGNNGYSSSGSPGFFWYVDNTSYGIYKSAGSWAAPNYQQLNLNFPTGIVIDGGSSYGRSGTVIQPGAGNVGIGTASPGAKLDVNGIIRNSAANGFSIGPDSGQNRVQTSGTTFQFLTSSSAAATTQVGGLAITSAYSNTPPANGLYVEGKAGIGVTDPGSYKLNVNGSTNVTGNLNITAGADGPGNIVAAGTIFAKYQDVAEWVESSEQLAAGTVVVLDSTKSNQITSSSVSYDTRVAGVISAQPGIALGEKSDSKVLVATTGRVKVKVEATKGAIHIGDLLVTSDVPGVAMRSEPVEFAGRKMHMPGTLIGKALEPLEKGSGEILVLLSLQ